MTDARTETAFESLQRDFDVHAPRFEAYLGPLPGDAESRAESGLLTVEDALRRETERLEDRIRPSGGGVAAYRPLAGPLPGESKGSTNDVVSITFTESILDGDFAQVDVELHNVYDAAAQRYRYSDPPSDAGEGETALIDYGKLVALRIGYQNNLHFVFEGIIKTYEVSFPADGASMVSFTAVDRRDALCAFNPTELESGETPNGEETVLKNLVAPAGFYLATRSSQQAPGGQPTPAGGPVSRPRDQDVGSYLKARAGRVALELSAFGETIFALRPGDDSSEALLYRYRQGLISFTPRFNASGTRTEVVVRSRVGTGPRIEGRATVEGLRKLGLTPPASAGESALQVVADASPTERSLEVTDVSVGTQDEADTLAAAILKRDLDRLFEADGLLLGDPRVRAGTSLDIEGVGRFDGRYYLTKTIHEYGAQGYRTRFKARRNTSPTAPASTSTGGAA